MICVSHKDENLKYRKGISKLHKVYSNAIIMVKSVNFVVLGKQDIAADFGKKKPDPVLRAGLKVSA